MQRRKDHLRILALAGCLGLPAAIPINVSLASETAATAPSVRVVLPGPSNDDDDLIARPGPDNAAAEAEEAAPPAQQTTPDTVKQAGILPRAEPDLGDIDEFSHAQICAMIEQAANRNGLPPAFFARLIWKESRFNINAVSPKGAEGIAQFMPATAAERGLKNSFDPRQALPASAMLLVSLRLQFGNLGLAAAAYNAGEGRVGRWLNGRSGLPLETQDYVLSITGEPAETFTERSRQIKEIALEDGKPFMEACERLPVRQAALIPGLAVEIRKPWGVQVAGGYRRAAVMRNWEQIKRRHASILSGLPVAVTQVKSPLGPKRIYAVRVGADSRIEANAICGRLRAQGGHCVVKKN